MPEGFHPSPPEAKHSIRRDEVPAEVRAYADNLMLQLDEIVARYGIADFRAARRMPDAERFAKLEAVMDIDDLQQYQDLIVGYREAVTMKRIPAGKRESWAAEVEDRDASRPFAYDKEKARELGFAELRVEAHPKAQEIVDAVYSRDPSFVTVDLTADKAFLVEPAIRAFWRANCADFPDLLANSIGFFRWVAEHRLSDTIDGDAQETCTRPTRPHVPKFDQAEFLLVMDWKEFNPTDAAERSAAVSAGTKTLFRRLFGQEDVTGLSRDLVNDGLFSDHEARIPTAQAAAVIRDLIGKGKDPGMFELRLMRYDEYSRAAKTQGYGEKNLSTWLDGYIGRGAGHRRGLVGGDHSYGGAANVDSADRDHRRGSLAVRLVLSRKA